MNEEQERVVKGPNGKQSCIRALMPDALAHVISHLKLSKVEMSAAIFGGDCPLCGSRRSFFLKANKRTAFCCECGANIAFR